MSVRSAGWTEGLQRTKMKLLQQNIYSYSPACEHGCYWHSKMSSRNINREMRSRSRMLCPLYVYPKIKTLLWKEKKKSHFKMWLGKSRKRERFFLAYSLFDTLTSKTWQTLCRGGSYFKFLLQRDHFRAKQINRLKEVRKHAKPGKQGQVWCILRPQNGTYNGKGDRVRKVWFFNLPACWFI